MLRSARSAAACSSSVIPASIRTSTDRTAAVACPRLLLPRDVSVVGSALPAGASGGLVTNPSRSSACSSTFIDCRVTNAPRASSEFERPGRWASSSRHE